jgi:Phosphate-induced protein 1 conserved region
VPDWWRTVTYYTDRSSIHVTSNLVIAAEHIDSSCSQGNKLTRSSMELIIKAAISSFQNALPLDTQQGVYLVLTSSDVKVSLLHIIFLSGCNGAICMGRDSGTQCPGMCTFPICHTSCKSWISGTYFSHHKVQQYNIHRIYKVIVDGRNKRTK